jgi:NADH-ubiquinone oxidoreductase chain 2
VAIALPSFNKQLSSIFITRISAIIFIYSGALAFNALYIQSIGSGIGIYSGLFHVTIISQLLDGFLLILAALILTAWPLITSSYYNKVIKLTSLFTDATSRVPLKNLSTLRKEGSSFPSTFKKYNYIGLYTPRTEYCLIVLFSGLGSSLLISSSDLLSLYLSIELQSFGLYILATLYRDYESATASGLKYFLLGALSSCFILLGAGLIYTFTGLTNFESIYSLISVSYSATQKILSGVSLGVIFIFVGFLFKVAAAPFHSWSSGPLSLALPALWPGRLAY